MAAATLLVSRVLHEDDDFITVEIGKRDDVVFNLQQNDDGETVGGDRFLTLIFLHNDGSGTAVPWVPWEDKS